MGNITNDKREYRKKRIEIENALIGALEKRNAGAVFYTEIVDDYMLFYDGVVELNRRIERLNAGIQMGDRAYIDLLAEKRRVRKQMTDMLTFLGLKLPEDKFGFGAEDDVL